MRPDERIEREIRESRTKHRCSDCRRVIDTSEKYGRYNHRTDCPKYPGPPKEVREHLRERDE